MPTKAQAEKAEDSKEPVLKDKLNELLDINYPLLKEFRKAAPGTFKHAQSLMSLAQNVCAAAGIESETVEVAAMYHDIGKTWAPHFFSENQPADENIHDNLAPLVSYYIVTRHVSDSVTILLANNFPLEVIKLVSQHHGKSILQAFYEKEVKINGKAALPSDAFRYKTTRPDSVSSMILMLCDQVEATSRAIYGDQKSDVAPDVFVTNVYAKLHQDGQFDNVQIYLGTLKKILSAIISDVAGMFHKRVKYDEDELLSEESPKHAE